MSWGEARPVAELTASELARGGVAFRAGDDLYRTTGEHLSKGGMGEVYLVERRRGGEIEPCVGKIFHHEYLYQLRTDEVTRGDHERNLRAMTDIRALHHPNLLPTYLSEHIADNHLMITPRKGHTLLGMVAQDDVPVRRRVELWLQAAQGLRALHDAGYLHRDFTLRNILVSKDRRRAYLFDFDLAISLAEVADQTYKQHYKGRLFGSPGYSVPPEILEPTLMDARIGPALDVYAAGGALFGLFTDQLPYGDTQDMWGLLLRISDGVVIDGDSQIAYPSTVPRPLRPIIDRCLERDPRHRYATIGELIGAVEQVLDGLDAFDAPRDSLRNTLRYGYGVADSAARLRQVHAARRDPDVALGDLELADAALSKYGYQIQRSLGRMNGSPLYVAAPVPMLLASGEFPDANTYPKVVTAVDLRGVDDEERFLDLWLGGYLPLLRRVRQGLLTPLFRAVHDEDSRLFLLFSEYVDNARFGTDLDEFDLSPEEALALGYLVSLQVTTLHRAGLAHNNISASSLLLKGVRDGQRAEPAMIGLVNPSFEPAAKVEDARRLCGLFVDWLSPARIASLESGAREQLLGLRALLQEQARGDQPAPTADELAGLMAGGLAVHDPNFAVLAQHAGDLHAYALLVVQHRLYNRLFA